jgi:circadian clock protein KaiC
MPTRNRKTSRTRKSTAASALAKVATGIDGFDEITEGGLPEGRPTLVCGGPGCGKTLFALEFLVHAAARGESGVFVTFEETEDDILKNAASLGYDLPALIKRKRLALEYIRVDHSPRPYPADHSGAAHRARHDRIALCWPQQRRRAAR